MDYPYKVFDPCGVPVMSAPEELRYPKNLELEMLAAGYTIRLHGRKITKKELTGSAKRRKVNMASPMLKTGDPCPCCGQPIKATDPAILAVLTHIRDAQFNVSDYKKYMEDMMRHASG